MGNKIKYLTMIPAEEFCIYATETEDLAKSISEYGLIEPVIAKAGKEGLEVINGRRRIACMKNRVVPTIVEESDITTDELRIQCISTAKSQRSTSELAGLIHRFYEGIKNQGRRTDLEGIEQIDSLAKSKEKFNLSPRTVGRYLRLYYLIPKLQKQIDEYKLPIKAGVELSYLSKQSQDILASLIDEGYSISVNTASQLRKSENGHISLDTLCGLTRSEKRRGFKRMYNIFEKYSLQQYTDEEVEDLVDKALNQYFKKDKVSWY